MTFSIEVREKAQELMSWVKTDIVHGGLDWQWQCTHLLHTQCRKCLKTSWHHSAKIAVAVIGRKQRQAGSQSQPLHHQKYPLWLTLGYALTLPLKHRHLYTSGVLEGYGNMYISNCVWYVAWLFFKLLNCVSLSPEYDCNSLSSLSQRPIWKLGPRIQCV